MSESKTTSLAIVPRTLDESADLAERFSKSSLLPKAMQGKAPDVLVTIMAGAEMGLAPMASLRAIHVIEGRPVLSADGMIAIVLGSGKAVYFERVEESEKAVTYETLRVGSKTPRRCTWTIEQAKAAGLHLKDNWRGYPRAMLASRAKAELARDVYPDVLMGCYTAEELEGPHARPDYIAPDREPEIADAEIVESPELAMIDAAETLEQLGALAKPLAALKGDAKIAARTRYAARKAHLEIVTATPAAEVSA